MTVRNPRPGDIEQPRLGQRLQCSATGTLLGISTAEMAKATGISKTAIWNVVADNRWPIETPAAEIRCALRALFIERGATDAQVEAMFYAHVRKAPGTVPVRSVVVTAAASADKPAPATAANAKVIEMLLPKQNLTPAAKKAFALFKNPFAGDVISADELFQNSETRYVREVCWQAAVNASFIAIVGESGAGKTTILDDLKTRIDADRRSIVLIEPSVMGMEDNNDRGKQLKSADIQCAMIMTLDPLATVAQTPEKRARQMKELLTQRTRAGDMHLLIIEEAHCLPIPSLKHLKRLHEGMRLGLRPMLGILLVAQPELTTKLQRYDTREVAQRCELVTLRPLDGDLHAYLAHRAQLVGRQLSEFIDDSGVDELRARLTWAQNDKRAGPVSLAYPLAVNNLLTACLNVAAGIGSPLVTKDVVRAV